MSDKSESFGEWFNEFKTDGEHESMENFDLKLFDLFALKNSCEHTWNHQQKKIDELENENKKLRVAFHQMKLNSKLLLDLVSSLKRSIEINADDAKKWCDEICIKELK